MNRISTGDMRQLLQVYFIMGSTNCYKDPLAVLEEAIAGGITLFQFREKGAGALTGQAKYKLAGELQRICQKGGVPFIVNDDIELAIALDADGVHIGQEDAPADVVRSKLRGKIVGVSAHTLDEAKLAVEQGADYLGLGPIFPTSTKEDAKAVQGTWLIEQLRNAGMSVPIVGIGGINQHNAASVMKAGADGVSVITAISHAESVAESTRQLRKAVVNK